MKVDFLDDTPRLVLADFLQDRDDPRGPLLRVVPEMFKVVPQYDRVPDAYNSSVAWRLKSWADKNQPFSEKFRFRFARNRGLRQACYGRLFLIFVYHDIMRGIGLPLAHPWTKSSERIVVGMELYACRLGEKTISGGMNFFWRYGATGKARRAGDVTTALTYTGTDSSMASVVAALKPALGSHPAVKRLRPVL